MAKYERESPHGLSLCTVAAEVTELSGAGITLSSSEDLKSKWCTSNKIAQDLMDLELLLGEGPADDANRSGVANEESNLLSPESTRWMLYAPEAAALGARAVFGFPVRIGGVRFGALSLFRDEPGTLSDAQSSDAYLMASVIGRAILAMQAGAPPGGLAGELEGQSTFDFAVHQAAGMLAVQGSLSVRDALVALRAHAFATNCVPSELAERVVLRQVHIDPVTGTWRDEMGREDS
ncbi:MAG TPA: ANTAR domain-containing protein [Acidimicrobiales bacterium]|jgi:hypothetical protein|nr:ANTAR domain-containing protein [Acidimicrobiales bacterium]